MIAADLSLRLSLIQARWPLHPCGVLSFKLTMGLQSEQRCIRSNRCVLENESGMFIHSVCVQMGVEREKEEGGGG